MNNQKAQIEKKLNYIKPKDDQSLDQGNMRLNARNEQRFNQSMSVSPKVDIKPQEKTHKPIKMKLPERNIDTLNTVKSSTLELKTTYKLPKDTKVSMWNVKSVKLKQSNISKIQKRKEKIDELGQKPKSLKIKKEDIKHIKKEHGNVPHFHVGKDGTINKRISRKSILLNNRANKYQKGIVLDRLKDQLINENIDESDVGFKAINSANQQRKELVRGTKNVRKLVKTKNRKKHLGRSAKQATKMKMQGMAVGTMESTNPVTDTGFTATSHTARNVKTTNEMLKKGKSLLRGKKAINAGKTVHKANRAGNVVRQRNRLAKMKNISKGSAMALQKGAKGVIQAGRYLFAKLQAGIGAKVALGIGGFLSIILILGISMGGIGGAFEAEDEETISVSAQGLSEDVLKWEDTVKNELAKYELEEYTDLILVLIHLESGGKLPDIMQSSESLGLPPNTITDQELSIQVGVKHFKSIYDDMKEYGVDLQTLIQAYNFGNGFIPYVAKNGKVWKQTLSDKFSNLYAGKLGWSNYGDSNYVSKVMEYLETEDDEIKLKDVDADFDLNGGKLAFPVPNYEGSMSSSYGWRIHPIDGIRKFHAGTDIPAPFGTPVIASADGVVVESGWKGGLGNAVVIDHGSNVKTLYGHNQSLKVKAGQTVKAGDVIAEVGSTGSSTGPHSHFEVHHNGEYTDPVQWLR